MIHFKKYAPSAQLVAYVQYYFVLEMREGEKGSQRDAENFSTNHPQGTFDLMFALRGGIRLVNHKEDNFELSKLFIMGQQEGYFNIHFQPSSQILGVVFYAESFSKLFNLPLAELTNTGINAEDILSAPYQEIYHQMLGSKTHDDRLKRLDSFISHELSKVDFSFTGFDKLIRAMRHNDGQLSVGKMAEQANLSERTLQRNMKNSLGVGPKSFSNILRFKEVLRILKQHPEYDWQDVLYHCGYYDQAHFIKDFKRYTGKTPRAFLDDNDNLSTLFIG
jgi:AraC-like DNA-binding protein